jgi:hypothetical protein
LTMTLRVNGNPSWPTTSTAVWRVTVRAHRPPRATTTAVAASRDSAASLPVNATFFACQGESAVLSHRSSLDQLLECRGEWRKVRRTTMRIQLAGQSHQPHSTTERALVNGPCAVSYPLPTQRNYSVVSPDLLVFTSIDGHPRLGDY